MFAIVTWVEEPLVLSIDKVRVRKAIFEPIAKGVGRGDARYTVITDVIIH